MCRALTGTGPRPAALRLRALRPQLKRDPLGITAHKAGNMLALSRLLLLSSFGFLARLASAQEPIPVTDGEGLCQGIHNSGECAAAIEAHQIPLSQGRVRRDGVTFGCG